MSMIIHFYIVRFIVKKLSSIDDNNDMIIKIVITITITVIMIMTMIIMMILISIITFTFRILVA